MSSFQKPMTLIGALLLAASAASSQVVINEVYYDAPGSDDGQVFVELYGPVGTDISGWTIQSVEGTSGGGGGNNPDNFTFPAGTSIGTSGFVVVADETGSSGTTAVLNADFIVGDMDLENGPDALQLLDAGGALVDALAYGPILVSVSTANGLAIVEGSPARDVFAPLSLERSPAGNDTGNNSVDFYPNIPTPGTTEPCCSAIEWVNAGFRNSPSTSAGESVGLDIFFSCAPNQPYLMLLSFTDPTVVPVPAPFPVFDSFTVMGLSAVNAAPFLSWSGNLGANGELVGVASLDFTGVTLPALPGPLPMYIGAIALDPSFTLYGTNFVTITLDP